jgi:hypothetical protein
MHSLQYSYLTGDVITKTLYEDLKERNVQLGGNELENMAIVKDIKEKMCSVSLDYLSAVQQVQYQ